MLTLLLISFKLLLNKNFRIRFWLILAFILLFVSYQYSGLKSYIKANNVVYKVQVSAAFHSKIPVELLAKKFSLKDEVREVFHKGWYKYSLGNFPDYYDAKSYRDHLITNNKTIGAFVVMFKDDIRMDGMDTISNEIQLSNPNPVNASQKLNYKIQIKASDVRIPIAELQKTYGITENISEEYINNMYKYTVGKFDNYEAAKNLLLNLSASEKIKDAFIVTYYGGKRVDSNFEAKVKYTKPKRNQTYTYHKAEEPKVYQAEPQRIYSPAIRRTEPKVQTIKNESDIILYHVGKKDLLKRRETQVTNAVITEPSAENSEFQEYKPEPVVETPSDYPFDIILFHYKDNRNIDKDLAYSSAKSGPYQEYKPENQSGGTSAVYDKRYSKSRKYNSNRINEKRTLLGQFIENIRYNFYKSFFIWLLVILIITFIINVLFVTIIIFTSRIIKLSKERRVKRAEEELQLLLAEFLFDPNHEKEALRKLKNISSSFERNVLLDELTRLSGDLSGEVLIKLKNLYYDMGLNKDSIDKLKSDKWFIRIKGCRELTRMKAYDSRNEIEKLINSKNDLLRSEAQMALIELSQDNPYYFLDQLKEDFIPWEQLNVHVMMQRNATDIPDFSKWLMSENESVILFAIEMIRVYRQIMNAPKIIRFFNHQNPIIREAAIITAGELGYVEVVPEMIKHYQNADDVSKVLILRSMQRLPDDTNKDFLKGILDGQNLQHIKLDAAKAMFALGIKGQVELKRYSQTNDAELSAIIKHVFDERI